MPLQKRALSVFSSRAEEPFHMEKEGQAAFTKLQGHSYPITSLGKGREVYDRIIFLCKHESVYPMYRRKDRFSRKGE